MTPQVTAEPRPIDSKYELDNTLDLQPRRKRITPGMALAIATTMIAFVVAGTLGVGAAGHQALVEVENGQLAQDGVAGPVAPGSTQGFYLKDRAGRTRHYVVSVPQSYNPKDPEPTPLLFAFHGWKGRAGDFTDGAFFHTKAPGEAIIVMPEGANAAWAGAPYATSTVKQDIDFVMKLVDLVKQRFAVDSSRIYALGISNGGGMVANLACQRSDVFAGIAMVAAAYYTPVKAGCSKGSVPVYTVHGTADNTIPYEGGRRHNVFISPVIMETLTYARRNHCAVETDPALELVKSGLYIFDGCESATRHLKIAGGGHRWPEDPEVNESIWDFLSSQSRAQDAGS